MDDTPLEARLRADLLAWMARNNWTPHAINVAMNRLHQKTMHCARIEQFIAGTYKPGADVLRSVDRFLKAFPAPMPLEEMREELDLKARQMAERKQQELLERRLATEQARAERRRRLLATEHRPKPKPTNPLFGLDKATIAALSGGTLAC